MSELSKSNHKRGTKFSAEIHPARHVELFANSSCTSCLVENRHLSYPLDFEYLDYPVEIPSEMEWVGLQLEYVKVTDAFQLYGALFDPSGNFRGHVQCPGGPGPQRLTILTGTRVATPGAIAGPIPSGTWTVRIDFDRFTQDGDFALNVFCGVGGPPNVPPRDVVEWSSHRERADSAASACSTPTGWVRGELHTHSLHSDGAATVSEIRDAARQSSLDFVAISDHFTYSHWEEVARLNDEVGHPLLLPAIEVTTHRGHANLHRLQRWHDVYTDGPTWAFSDLAEEVHDEGGLICINHPYSGPQAWSRDDFNLEEADLIEVVNRSQGVNNIAAIGLWDHLLNSGARVFGVAGTDSHNPFSEEGVLGVATTVTKGCASADEIYAVLETGQAYVSTGGHLILSMSYEGSERVVGMGGVLEYAPGRSLEINADVSVPSKANLLIFRNGLLWKMVPVAECTEGATISVIDRQPIEGYYRAEIHADPPHGYGASCWRTDESLYALSNPIWIRNN